MGVIERIKSVLGLGGADGSTATDAGRPAESDDVDVTVEHEPATASEDAVKGTDTASEAAPGAGADAGGATDESETADETTPGVGAEESETETEPEVEEAESAPGVEKAEGESEGAEAESAVEKAEPEEAETEPEGPVDDGDLEDIKGIGPAYASRLREAGVESVADLAAADPDDLDEQTGIGPTRVSDWIERARQR